MERDQKYYKTMEVSRDIMKMELEKKIVNMS